ncbi:FAD/NAD(P)-binding protein [Roseinatronobacter sp. HJB301]|uniref:FAD/NAD(P)-binding protein n=1 Tax=Roseinatronobacter alkalisoli TaxID=3028235 RepID=A0ABT5TF76_9RHOB|nr:FAD/NAD(P)-binding protein [Roseinatronobacter sp. HJB301]MDD7973594.1 FAD/NAD(P)-binding protein [Roseinatronobacter sp. HJB301]
MLGTGPRGISVIERIAARMHGRKLRRPLLIYAIDDVEVGCGKIWRTDQPDWLIMNTRCRNATMFPHQMEEESLLHSERPTFMEWWQRVDQNFPGPSGFAPRGLYGKYLRYVLDLIELNLPPNVTLQRIQDEVVDVRPQGEGFVLQLASGGGCIVADRLVVSTGYARGVRCATASQSEGTRHITAFDLLDTLHSGFGLPADLSGQVVALKGLGLTFYDVLSDLTIGRGGRYEHNGDELRYVPSGREPARILAGSRSGLPLPVRGRDDRPTGVCYTPRLFTRDRVAALRAGGANCFRTSYLPWVEAEVNLVYLQRTLSNHAWTALCKGLDEVSCTPQTILTDLERLAAKCGSSGLLRLERLARPYGNRQFASQSEFRQAAMSELALDIKRAAQGEFTDPVKAALDVLRHIRPIIRQAVDLGGLNPESHVEFIRTIGPMIAFLSTGPSPWRARQLEALMNAGLVEILGPSVRFDAGEDGGKLWASSDQVVGFRQELDVLIDAFVLSADMEGDPNPVIRSLTNEGILRSFMGTGGAEVTSKPFHPVSRAGAISERVHVLGIPTESTRWFLHVGLIEPGLWDEFLDDAVSVATTLTEGVLAPDTDPQPLDSEQPVPLAKYLT